MRLLAALCLVSCPLLAPAKAVAEVDIPDLNAAFAAADREDWLTAEELAAPGGPIGADLIEWMRLRDDAGTWDEIIAFLDRHGDWPGTDRIRARAETLIPEDLPAEDVLAFFEGHDTETGQGVVARARALEAAGETGEAAALVVQAWLTRTFDTEGEAILRGSYGQLLAEHHAARVDMLLWRWRVSDAQRLFPLLDDETRSLAEARVGYIQGAGNLPALVDKVPAALRESAGFRYDRYNWLAGRGRNDDAIEMLEAASVSADALGEPFRWSGWRRVLARLEMRTGDPERAYRLAANHFLQEGTAFSDLEWLAGYIALTRLDRPDIALLHFQTLERNVWTPISQGRAWYWIGRAQEARGDGPAAMAAYTEGGQNQTAFYGLLAAEKAGMPLDPLLTGLEDFPPFEQTGLAEDPLVMAGLHLLKGGERGLAVLFLAEAGRILERDELGSLGALLDDWDETYFEVLLGKSAAQREMVIPSIYFPLHDMAGMDLPVEPALALSIARRESEFRVDAGSSVGALGLMQLMPGTAQDVAGWLDLPYSRARLTRDWTYNATLGSRYLAYLTEEFGASPSIVAAGYNAGPGRPRQWIDLFGDPRLGEVDIVDWVESIPFEETRNYVMRVTESIPVYRARLTGETGELAFRDLLVGVKPLVRPVARPDGSLSTEGPEVTVSTAVAPGGAEASVVTAPSALAPVVSVAPPPRPDREAETGVGGGISAPASISGPSGVRPPSRPTGPGG
ncbi:lytic transglycosylase domain-containing protein [Roseisalinus antarcticus]|uniref:Soluble lytic murein transglycosylase n=1 Tax=Roseisalinus antarcticus TaxID=254357 RepID=A0A1Y5SN08_9RHOB|nr:lytic transglycosylase domain-containing protein [Roseisalinus antarcticus]SLN44112.1 Soluble lytic murein transglycosylase precursor [Roseisalinus antarcticus]